MRGNTNIRYYTLILLSSLSYLFIAYVFPRHSGLIVLPFLVCFILYVVILRSNISIKDILVGALVVRLIFLFSSPSLSDDIYRFIWDGRMLNNNLNPFLYLPEDIVGKYKGLDKDLFSKLNSQEYHSVYPPLAQIIFGFTQWIFPESISGATVVLRSIVIVFEMGTLFMMLHLLKIYRISQRAISLYAFNPLVVIELAGNLHFEGITLFFLLLSIALLISKKIKFSGVSMGLAISAKLIPLIVLPLFLRRIKFTTLIKWGLIIFVTLLILFIPFIEGGFHTELLSGLTLYFKKFEFNASIYYLIREYGFLTKGFNTIQTVGPQLAILTFVLIMAYTVWDYLKRKNFFEGMLWVFLIYFLMATTVHPWYIVYLLAMCIFTSFRFPLVWSFLIFFTYLGYSELEYSENPVTIIAEYSLLTGAIIYELYHSVKYPSKPNFFKERLT